MEIINSITCAKIISSSLYEKIVFITDNWFVRFLKFLFSIPLNKEYSFSLVVTLDDPAFKVADTINVLNHEMIVIHQNKSTYHFLSAKPIDDLEFPKRITNGLYVQQLGSLC